MRAVSPNPCESAVPRQSQHWQGEAFTLGVNALVSGLSAGAMQKIRNRSFWDGFRRGSMGGVLTFAGKRLAVESFSGAGFAGREIAAVGSSIVRNAGIGKPSLSEIVFPLGPTRLYVRPHGASPLRLQVDVAATAMLAYALADRDLQFEYAASLSSGALVFREPESPQAPQNVARATAGLIRMRENAWYQGEAYVRQVLGHERVHVLQYDQSFLLLGEPLEDAVLSRIPGGVALGRWADFGLETPIWALFHALLPYANRPWEAEAHLLSRTGMPERWKLQPSRVLFAGSGAIP